MGILLPPQLEQDDKRASERPGDRGSEDAVLVIFPCDHEQGRAGSYLITRSVVDAENLGVTSTEFFEILCNTDTFVQDLVTHVERRGTHTVAKVLNALGDLPRLCRMLPPRLWRNDGDEWCRAVPDGVRILDVVSLRCCNRSDP